MTKNLEQIAIDLLDMDITKRDDIKQVITLTNDEIEKVIEIMRSK